MLDFAIRFYLPRLLEECLRCGIPGDRRSVRNASYWNRRYGRRNKPQQEIFITYQQITEKNDERGLILHQEYRIWQKHELSQLVRAQSQ